MRFNYNGKNNKSYTSGRESFAILTLLKEKALLSFSHPILARLGIVTFHFNRLSIFKFTKGNIFRKLNSLGIFSKQHLLIYKNREIFCIYLMPFLKIRDFAKI